MKPVIFLEIREDKEITVEIKNAFLTSLKIKHLLPEAKGLVVKMKSSSIAVERC